MLRRVGRRSTFLVLLQFTDLFDDRVQVMVEPLHRHFSDGDITVSCTIFIFLPARKQCAGNVMNGTSLCDENVVDDRKGQCSICNIW